MIIYRSLGHEIESYRNFCFLLYILTLSNRLTIFAKKAKKNANWNERFKHTSEELDGRMLRERVNCLINIKNHFELYSSALHILSTKKSAFTDRAVYSSSVFGENTHNNKKFLFRTFFLNIKKKNLPSTSLLFTLIQ